MTLDRTRSRFFAVMRDYGYILLGSAIVGVTFNMFLLPNRIAAGGVSGISTILQSFGFEAAYVQWAFNIPLFIAGVLILGGKFGVKTLVGSVFLPLVVYLTRDISPATHNALLAAIFGGVGIGAGIGMVFLGRGSTGGTALAAQIIHKFTGLSHGKCLALIDGTIVLSAMLVFTIEQGLYAMLGVYISSKTIDVIQVGLTRSKMAMIITNREEEIRKAVLVKIDRGVTKISAVGGYTDDERPILMCVVGQTEFTKLKQLVKHIDESAFVIAMDASEVLGEGFKRA
ncbi:MULTISPECIES: YitT family protein [Bacillus]|uniref:YitT family protein n=1 Tax=Bacillus glycinifermentans TaxID=1664069 RepID=A0AAJ3Z1W4_9BACI|nr:MULTISPECIES: YitT family protein [Bacillus]KKB75085.1 membrane protein [Bacillus sp. TH008]MBU8787530.1 YitT family protein [Bacillus glycinifermentans]MDU0070386.1 YitT family protein [Bacillus sp. IG6]MED8018172.1 YitT family protein [Bacillus glycinifermentans]NUJ16329.1 YitT family protein [Bacillus glycinifermentans]